MGYFSRDSAKNKFLDLFSALAAPNIRASPMRSITKPFPKARYSSAFSVEMFVKEFVYYLPELQIISCEATSH